MARVPIVQGPSVGLSPVSRERIRPVDNGGGALGGLGRGMQQLGQTGMQFAQAQDRLLEEQDEAGSKALDAEAIPLIQKSLTEFTALQGSNASAEALAAARKRMLEQRDEFLKRAATPRMQRMLGDVLDQRLASAAGQMEAHSVKQIGVAWEMASVSRQTASAEAAMAASDPVERRMHIDTGVAELRKLGERKGAGEDVLKVEALKFASGIHRRVALDMIDGDNVDGALNYLEANKGEIAAGDESDIKKALRDPLERRQTTEDTAGILRAEAGTEAGASSSPHDPLGGAGRLPVNGGGYGAARDYGAHNAVDIPAARGTPIKPERVGTARVSRSAKGGNIVTVDYGDGTVDKFMHLDAVRVKDGDRVTADTVVGTVGTTGRSSGPHLHWQRLVGGKPVNPLEARSSGPQQTPQRHDLGAALAEVDRRADEGGWSPERRDRAKAAVEKMVAQDELLIRRREDEADRQAWDAIDALPNNRITSIEQIPASIRSRMSARARMQIEDEIARNNKPKEIEANGDAAITLKVLAARDEETFKAIDLRQYRSQLTPGEFASLATDQAKMRATPADAPTTANVRAEIDRTITFYGGDIGLGKNVTDRKNEDGRRTYGRIQDSMRAYLERATEGGKRKPTDDDLKAAFDHATMEVILRDQGDRVVRRYEVDGPARMGIRVPNDVKARIEQSFARERRRLPRPEETIQIYLQNKGRPGFWR